MTTKEIIYILISICLVIVVGVWLFTLKSPSAEPVGTATSTDSVVLTKEDKAAIWDTFVKHNECIGEEATTSLEVLKMSEEGRQIQIATGTDFWYCKGFPMVY